MADKMRDTVEDENIDVLSALIEASDDFSEEDLLSLSTNVSRTLFSITCLLFLCINFVS